MEEHILELVIANAPNYLGFIVLTLILNRTLARVLDLVERCVDDDDDDSRRD